MGHFEPCSPNADLPKLDDSVYEILCGPAVPEKPKGGPVTLYDREKGDAHDVAPHDALQGQVSDCFLIASIGAVIQSHPDPDAFVKDMIKDNGDGTYTVRFFDLDAGGTTVRSVVVNSDLFKGGAHSADSKEAWAAVVEKAYIKAYGDHGTIKEGSPAFAMEHLTGLTSHAFPMAVQPELPPGLPPIAPTHISLEALKTFHDQGYATTFLTPGPDSPITQQPAYKANQYGEELHAHHTYYLKDVDMAKQTVTVLNPWNHSTPIVVPYADLDKVFMNGSTNPVKYASPPAGVPPYPMRGDAP